MKIRSLVTLVLAAAGFCGAADLRFRPEGPEFQFDTGVLRGKLRAGGKSAGLDSVTHVPYGAKLSRSLGLFSHYRVFTTNHRYGTAAWDWPSEAKLRPDGSVEVRWPAAPGRPFDMWAVYRWSGPATLDLETGVRARAELEGFESFLASYFGEQFTSASAFTREEVFTAATKDAGAWQMFPRGEDLLPLIGDGRWKLLPNPVDWVVRSNIAEPLGVRRDPKSGLTAILMAPREDCFALAMPQQEDTHYSLYLSLFGRTIKDGRTARARSRLMVADDPGDARILDLYRAYLGQLRRR